MEAGGWRRLTGGGAGSLFQRPAVAQHGGHLLGVGELIVRSQFQSGGGCPDADRLTGLDLTLLGDARPVHVGSVAGVEFTQEHLRPVGEDHAMLDRDGSVGDNQMILVPATDRGFLLFQLVDLSGELFVGENEFCHGRSTCGFGLKHGALRMGMCFMLLILASL